MKLPAARSFAVWQTVIGMAAAMRRELWFFFIMLAAGIWSNTGIAASSAVAEDSYPSKAAPSKAAPSKAAPSKAAPSTGGNPGSSEAHESTAAAGSWRLVLNSAATGGIGAAAILHTADFERSDPRLAGLMLQCGRQGIEAVVVVVEPFPPHVQPQVTLRTPEHESSFVGTVTPAGAGIRLPGDAASLAAGPWNKAPELEIKVTDGGTAIGGVVVLSGLSAALQSLNAACVRK